MHGKRGFFARLEQRVGKNAYDRLVQAHKVRNRIAHVGQGATSEFTKILPQLSVPKESWRGLSVGRLLIDHPAAATEDDRWFHRFICSYRNLANDFIQYMRI